MFPCFFFVFVFFALFPVEFRWPDAYFLFFSVFLLLYIQNFWTSDNWSKKIRIQKQFPLSVFVFIDYLAASALQDAGGYAISRQKNLELHLGCHACWLSYFTLVCLWYGRTDGRAYGQVSMSYVGLSTCLYRTFDIWRSTLDLVLSTLDNYSNSEKTADSKISGYCRQGLRLQCF